MIEENEDVTEGVSVSFYTPTESVKNTVLNSDPYTSRNRRIKHHLCNSFVQIKISQCTLSNSVQLNLPDSSEVCIRFAKNPHFYSLGSRPEIEPIQHVSLIVFCYVRISSRLSFKSID